MSELLLRRLACVIRVLGMVNGSRDASQIALPPEKPVTYPRSTRDVVQYSSWHHYIIFLKAYKESRDLE